MCEFSLWPYGLVDGVCDSLHSRSELSELMGYLSPGIDPDTSLCGLHFYLRALSSTVQVALLRGKSGSVKSELDEEVGTRMYIWLKLAIQESQIRPK